MRNKTLLITLVNKIQTAKKKYQLVFNIKNSPRHTFLRELSFIIHIVNCCQL